MRYLAPAAVLFSLLFTSCSPSDKADARRAADEAKHDLKKAGEEVKKDLKQAGREIKRGAEEVKRDVNSDRR